MGAVFSTVAAILGAVLILSSSAGAAFCQAPRQLVSDIDPRLMYIDQNAVLGNKIDPGTELIDDKGREFRWEEMLGKPFILVLSYYTCDGSCSIINQDLANLLKGVTAVKAGEDFQNPHRVLRPARHLEDRRSLSREACPSGQAGWRMDVRHLQKRGRLKKANRARRFQVLLVSAGQSFPSPGSVFVLLARRKVKPRSLSARRRFAATLNSRFSMQTWSTCGLQRSEISC